MSDMPSTVSGLVDIIKKYGFEYFGVFYGKYRGIVVSNQDPEKLGRVKVNVPQVSGKNIMETWAWPSGLVGGEDFGFFFIPPKGASVWVSFENGDPNHPVWEGGHWARGKTPDVSKRAKPDNRVFQTKNWIMEMDDEVGSEKFKITDRSSGNSFEFDTTSGDLNVNVTGNENITTTGNANHTVSGDLSKTVSGNKSNSISGNSSDSVTGNSSETVTGNKSINCVGFSLAATGSSTMTFGSSTINLSPSEISFNVGGHTLEINGSGVHIDGHEFIAHTHGGVQTGGGTTGGVI